MLITLSFLLLTLPDGISVRQEGQATTDEISVKFLGRIDNNPYRISVVGPKYLKLLRNVLESWS